MKPLNTECRVFRAQFLQLSHRGDLDIEQVTAMFFCLSFLSIQVVREKNYGTERMRQKLFVVGLAKLVKISNPLKPAELVICGTQLTGGNRL